MVDLLPHTFAYLPPSAYATLERSCRSGREFVQRRRRAAAQRLGRWLLGRQLAPECHLIWHHTLVTKRTLIRSYMARYPEQHVEEQIQLFPRKLQRPELAQCGGGGGRRRLRRILQRCALLEIMYVGW
jgi:hypothetical protein